MGVMMAVEVIALILWALLALAIFATIIRLAWLHGYTKGFKAAEKMAHKILGWRGPGEKEIGK